ncbi:hypothetical protein [Mesorhizobium argentiipisi]|uniref:Uncharacterized protein n=1 Tax=Mesorhizobium argentiipisi TaxID=3015175 RepID=A0ABU8KJ58_9HYPH
MTISDWTPPSRKKPSPQYLGDPNQATIWIAVGRASSEWEHGEVILCRLFQFFCETPSFAASQVYGTPSNFLGRLDLVQIASEEFFLKRKETQKNLEMKAEVEKLLSAFAQANKERNKIVHAMVHGMTLEKHGIKHSGYYLGPSYYSTRKRKFDLIEGWPMGADYFYRSAEINLCADRFSELLREGMQLWLQLQDVYGVPSGTQFAPREHAPERR